jgi:hypothetical protein
VTGQIVRTVTERVFDDKGNVVREVTTTEYEQAPLPVPPPTAWPYRIGDGFIPTITSGSVTGAVLFNSNLGPVIGDGEDDDPPAPAAVPA